MVHGLNGTGESNGDSRRRDLIRMILAANKILCEKSFSANKKGLYGPAESGRAHKRDGRVPGSQIYYLPPLNPIPAPGEGEGRG